MSDQRIMKSALSPELSSAQWDAHEDTSLCRANNLLAYNSPVNLTIDRSVAGSPASHIAAGQHRWIVNDEATTMSRPSRGAAAVDRCLAPCRPTLEEKPRSALVIRCE